MTTQLLTRKEINDAVNLDWFAFLKTWKKHGENANPYLLSTIGDKLYLLRSYRIYFQNDRFDYTNNKHIKLLPPIIIETFNSITSEKFTIRIKNEKIKNNPIYRKCF